MNTMFILNHWLDRSVATVVRALRGTAGPAPHIWLPGERQALRSAAASTRAGKSRPLAPVAHGARPTQRQLRVIQVLERGMPRGSTGRLFMSGGIDDICAELDRLVRREEAMLARPLPASQAR